jgi:hypothetical protein
VEPLEDRALPSTYTAASVADLIADINAANQHVGFNTITLAPNTPFVLTTVDNTTNGANGLPVIAKGNLTIVGSGDTLERSSATATPSFRLFDVGNNGTLTLVNLTLQNGFAFGSGPAAEGGAIYNLGSLDLNGVTVQQNTARGSGGKNGPNTGNGQDAAGGGIWSQGSLTLENGTTVQGNTAVGGMGGANASDLHPGSGSSGGNGFGGGVYVAGGTVTLSNATLSSNLAEGGFAGQGYRHPGLPGNGFGGGLYVAAGTVTLHGGVVASNTAQRVPRSSGGGYGGGLYIAAGATVYLDAFTLANTINNTADIDPNIDGSYVLQT